jgi:hypothetical protein
MRTSAISDLARGPARGPNAYATADFSDVPARPGGRTNSTNSIARGPVLTMCAALLAAVTPAAAEHIYSPHASPVWGLPAANDANDAAAGDAARQRFQELARVIADEPFDSVTSHPADEPLQAYVREFGASSLRARLLGGEPLGHSQVASILALLGRVLGVGEAEKIALLSTALSSRSLEVRDAAIQAAELWGDHASLHVLDSHQDPVAWLDDYRRRAANEIRRDLAGRE